MCGSLFLGAVASASLCLAGVVRADTIYTLPELSRHSINAAVYLADPNLDPASAAGGRDQIADFAISSPGPRSGRSSESAGGAGAGGGSGGSSTAATHRHHRTDSGQPGSADGDGASGAAAGSADNSATGSAAGDVAAADQSSTNSTGDTTGSPTAATNAQSDPSHDTNAAPPPITDAFAPLATPLPSPAAAGIALLGAMAAVRLLRRPGH